MKLNSDFITHSVGGSQVMVAAGESSRRFSGLVRSNATAAYITELLQNDITESALVDAMEARYDAPRAVLEKDVANILDKLRGIGALEE